MQYCQTIHGYRISSWLHTAALRRRGGRLAVGLDPRHAQRKLPRLLLLRLHLHIQPDMRDPARLPPPPSRTPGVAGVGDGSELLAGPEAVERDGGDLAFAAGFALELGEAAGVEASEVGVPQRAVVAQPQPE